MAGNHKAAWTDYWTSHDRRGESGCLPKAGSIDAILTGIWRDAARDQKKGGRVLDLATGDGTVLRTIHKMRRDLRLVGVDSAARLPHPPKGLTLMANTSMEALPFAAQSVDLVTSQFGVEYGDTAAIVAELARVIAGGGEFRFVLHHHASPIVAHNMQRMQALVWVAIESDLLRKARALTKARARIPLATPPQFKEVIKEAGQRFPGQSVAAEFTTAVFQILEADRLAGPGETLKVLDTLETKAFNEISRIEALREAALDVNRLTKLIGHLAAAGFQAPPPSILRNGAHQEALAWLVGGRSNAATTRN